MPSLFKGIKYTQWDRRFKTLYVLKKCTENFKTVIYFNPYWIFRINFTTVEVHFYVITSQKCFVTNILNKLFVSILIAKLFSDLTTFLLGSS